MTLTENTLLFMADIIAYIYTCKLKQDKSKAEFVR